MTGRYCGRARERFWEIDFLRGLCVSLMIVDHLMFCLYDILPFLNEMFGTNIFAGAEQIGRWYWTWDLRILVRQVVITAFFLLCGVSCTLTRGNFRRGILLGIVAAGITAVTYVVENNFGLQGATVLFGVIHMIAAGVFLYAFIDNAAVAVGINAGGGIIENCYAADSAAINRGGWVLVKAEDGVTDMYMTFTANTIYQLAFCGKTWGLIQNCFALDHGVVQPEYMEEKIVSSIEGTAEPFEITERLPLASDLEFFGFSRLDDDPNEGGDAFTGRMVNCQMLSFAEMKTAQNYIDAKFDTAVWNIADGAYPTLKRVFEI